MKLTLQHTITSIALVFSFVAPLAAGSNNDTIRMKRDGGVYVVPVRINDAITLNAIVDSGASSVSVPVDVVLTLMRMKTVSQRDFLGKKTYVLADGSKVPSQQFRIRSLTVGNKSIENVVASITSVNGDILLGQSFLSRFKTWSVDNEKQVLVLGQGAEDSLKSGQPTPTPRTSPIKLGVYSVLVSSQRSDAEALAAYQLLQNKFPTVLSGRKPIIQRVDAGERGLFFRVHVGPFSTAEEAGELCQRLRAAGGLCLVPRTTLDRR